MRENKAVTIFGPLRLSRCVLSASLLVMVSLWGCGRDGAGSAEKTAAPRGVVLIVFNALRADHVSCYGYDRPTTPNLDSLAARGVRFDQVISPAPWSLPAMTALLSGDYPGRVGSDSQRALGQDNKLSRSLVQSLQSAGVVTAGFTEGGIVSAHFGFDRGFDTFAEHEGAVQMPRPGKPVNPNAAGGIENTFKLAGEFLAARGKDDKPFFLLIHSYEPHLPYTNRHFAASMKLPNVTETITPEIRDDIRRGKIKPTQAQMQYIRAMYDGDVHNSDRHLGELLETLKRLGLDEHTVVIVTSDHGEELNDQYPTHTADNGHSLHDALLRVPLVVYDPTRRFTPAVVKTQVRLYDVMPTVVQLMGVNHAAPTDGQSLLPLLRGESAQDRPALAGYTLLGPPRITIRARGYKYIASLGRDAGYPTPLLPAPPSRALFDLTADPAEASNIADRKPELSDQLHLELMQGYEQLNEPLPRPASAAAK